MPQLYDQSRDEPPIFAQSALGYRAWIVSEDGQLRSVGAGATTWHPGINIGYCAKHQHPVSGCECGLYAYYTRAQALKLTQGQKGTYLIGSIAARGAIEAHYGGFRAEQAVITALALAHGSEQRAQLAGQTYQVPLVPIEQLTELGPHYAQPVPRNERPGPPPKNEQPMPVLVEPWRNPGWRALMIGTCLAFFILTIAQFFVSDLVNRSLNLLHGNGPFLPLFMTLLGVGIYSIAVLADRHWISGPHRNVLLTKISVLLIFVLLINGGIQAIKLSNRQIRYDTLGQHQQEHQLISQVETAEQHYLAHHHQAATSVAELRTIDPGLSRSSSDESLQITLAAATNRVTVRYDGDDEGVATQQSGTLIPGHTVRLIWSSSPARH